MSFSLVVFFEDPFWVGLFSRSEGDQTQYCRIVFGGEPSEIEIYHYFLKNFRDLRFSAALPSIMEKTPAKNPKRRQREASRQMQLSAGEKRSYSIIKQALGQEQKEKSMAEQKQRDSQHEKYVREIKDLKRKEKHKGH